MIFADFFLFVYDIHDAKKIPKIVKRLELINSMRIQRSIFEIQGTKEEVLSLIQDVKMMIDTKTDKLAIIPLCEKDYKLTEFFGMISKQVEVIPDYYIL